MEREETTVEMCYEVPSRSKNALCPDFALKIKYSPGVDTANSLIRVLAVSTSGHDSTHN